jgi:hypothetical protein
VAVKIFTAHVDAGRARSSHGSRGRSAMKYLCFIKHAESYRNAAPPAGFMEAMTKFMHGYKETGALVDTGGLGASKDTTRVRLADGVLTVTDGPFTETKEIVGGWAILQGKTKADVLRVATAFMELHRAHWPGFEGESELHLMLAPGEAM